MVSKMATRQSVILPPMLMRNWHKNAMSNIILFLMTYYFSFNEADIWFNVDDTQDGDLNTMLTLKLCITIEN